MLDKLKQLIKQTPPGKAYLRQKFQVWSERDEAACRFYQQFVNAGDTVFDVGANRGNRAKLFLKLKARAILVEPQPACAAYLRNVLKGTENWTLVEAGLASVEGEQEMLIASRDVLSTFSKDWLETIEKSGRFGAEAKWTKRQMVRMTTLDALIQKFGLPAFLKIDVEGYEFEVLSGLSVAPKVTSIEFAPEYIAKTIACIDRLSSLADMEFQVSLDESMALALPGWISNAELKDYLSKIAAANDTGLFGDIYARRK
jgi:FkbM family methyltransferase